MPFREPHAISLGNSVEKGSGPSTPPACDLRGEPLRQAGSPAQGDGATTREHGQEPDACLAQHWAGSAPRLASPPHAVLTSRRKAWACEDLSITPDSLQRGAREVALGWRQGA